MNLKQATYLHMVSLAFALGTLVSVRVVISESSHVAALQLT